MDVCHVAVVVGVAPTDLGVNTLKSVGLFEVDEGLLSVGHVGACLGHEFDYHVLGGLGEANVVPV
jgi:hypothetical protein